MKRPKPVCKKTFYENRRYGYPDDPTCVVCPHYRRERIERDRTRYRSRYGGYYPVRRYCALLEALRSARKPRELPHRIRRGARSQGPKSPRWCPLRRIVEQ